MNDMDEQEQAVRQASAARVAETVWTPATWAAEAERLAAEVAWKAAQIAVVAASSEAKEAARKAAVAALAAVVAANNALDAADALERERVLAAEHRAAARE